MPYPPEFQVDEFKPDNQDFIPDAPVSKPSSLIGDAWNWATRPITTLPSELTQQMAKGIDEPTLNRSPINAMARGFGAGALTGLGDVISGFTSPLNLATMGSFEGAGMFPQYESMLSNIGRTLSLPIVGEGVYHAATGENLQHKLMGIPEIAGGLAGLAHVPSAVEAPRIPEVLPREETGMVHIGPSKRPFIAGEAGVAENRPYTIDISQPLPGDMMSGSGTVLPHETEGLVQIPPDLAARRGIGFGEPQKTFKGAIRMNDDGTFTSLETGKTVDMSGSEIEPSFARAEGGKVKIGADVASLGKVLGSSLYQGDISKIATKELLQNSIDAVRDLGAAGDIKVDINKPKGFIAVQDNGKGLTRQEIETVFTDLGASGKRDQESAVGGFGLAKAAPLLGGDRVEFSTVTLESDGLKYEHTFDGTPEELLKGVNLKSKIVNSNTPTGTVVKTHVPEESDFWQAREVAKAIGNSSRGYQGKITLIRDSGNDIYSKEKFEPAKNFLNHHVETLKTPDADISVIIPKDTAYGESYGVPVNISNNGMWQGKQTIGQNLTPSVPRDITVDITSKVPEGHANYPFTANRESLRGPVLQAIEKHIEDTVVKPSIGRRSKELSDVYSGMPEFSIPTKGDRKFFIYDTGKRYKPEELSELMNNPQIIELATHISDGIHDVMSQLGHQGWNDRLEKIGLILDESLHGIHIPNPAEGGKKSAILINPFEIMKSANPDQAATNISHTILHEIAHIEGGGHNESFTQRLGKIYSQLGRNTVRKIEDNIYGAIADPNGLEYNEQISPVLRKYFETRRRPETTPDPLTGTGIKSENTRQDRKRKVPINDSTNDVRTPTESINNLIKALREAGPAREMQEEEYSAERGKRIAMASQVKTPGLAGFQKQLSHLKGELPKQELNPNLLTKTDVDKLIDAVTNSQLSDFRKIRAKTGLVKIMGGIVPQRNEIGLLRSVFGNELGDTIELHSGLPIKMSTGRLVNEATAVTKSLMASWDASAPLRQGLPLMHRKEYWNAFKEMGKYFSDEQLFNGTMQAITDRPGYEFGEQAGLKNTDVSQNLGRREEQFLSSTAERIPVVGAGVRASERMYVGFLNKLRADTFDNLIQEAKDMGLEVTEKLYNDRSGKPLLDDTGAHMEGPNKLARELADYVNVSTGRGSLGKLERISGTLNNVFFSPRMIASRLTMLNPNYYITASPFMRQQALKSLFTIAAFGSTITGLAVASGAKTSLDPTSADFLKARIGNTRIDPFGGFQQYIVAAFRLMHDLKMNEDMTDNLKQFGENKLSPVASFIDTLMKGNKAFPPGGVGKLATDMAGATGKNARISGEVINRFTPMILSDLVDVYKNDPNLLPVGILGALGMGIQTYGPNRTMNMSPMQMNNKMQLR